ncbi:MAG: FkbM family methyltransferase [Pseudomonadota bacterium]
MLASLKRAVINTPLQPIAEHLILYPSARLQGLIHPKLKKLYTDDYRLDRAVEKLIEPHFNCIDIGCHIGSMLGKFVRLAPEGAHVAIEPTPEKAQYLKRKFPNVTIHQLALSDAPGKAEFFINPDKQGFNSLQQRDDEYAQTEAVSVDVETLDRVLPPEYAAQLIKMDVEGFELSVLKGANGFVERCRPTIIFESGPARPASDGVFDGDDLFHYITENLNYTVYSPAAYLRGEGPMSLEQHRAHRTYPFEGFNFIALPT